MKCEQCIVTVEYVSQDGRVKIMSSKPLSRKKANKERNRLNLMSHKTRIEYVSR